MADVFISYAREDADFVRRLHAGLRAAGRDTWVDWQGLAPTVEWMDEIHRAIDAADATLFIISPDWVGSRICAQELAHAVAQRKRLIPVVCRNAADGSVPEALARLNWVLMRDGDVFDAALAQLMQALDTDLDLVRAHTRLVVRSTEWVGRGRDASGLLRGRDLADAEAWLARAAGQAGVTTTPEQVDYIAASRVGSTRRQRQAIGAVGFAALLAIGLAVWALIERDTADDNAAQAAKNAAVAQANEREAKTQEGIAQEQRGVAEEQRGLAEQQRSLADERATEARAARDAERAQRLAAEAAQREAVAQRDEALRQRRFALARQLAARAEFLQGSDPALGQKAVLLAAESMQLLPNAEADAVLRRALARQPAALGALAHGGVADPLAVAGDDTRVVIGDAKGMLRIFNLADRSQTSAHALKARITHVAVAQVGLDGLVVAAGTRRGGLRLLDQRAGGSDATLDCDVHALAVSNDQRRMAAACAEDALLITLAAPGSPAQVRKLAGLRGAVAIAFHPDGDRVASIDSRGQITLTDLRTDAATAVWTLPAQDSGSASSWSRCCVGFIGWSAWGRQVAGHVLGEREVRLVAADDGKLIARLAHDSPVRGLSFDPVRDALATGALDGRIRVWDSANGALLSQMAHADEVSSLRLQMRPMEGEARLLSTSTDRTARVWDPFTGNELLRAAHTGPALWAAQRNGQLAVVEQAGALQFWRAQARPIAAPLMTSARAPPTLATCSNPAGKAMAIAHRGGTFALVGDALMGNALLGNPPVGTTPPVDKLVDRTTLVASRNAPGVALAPDCSLAAFGTDDSLQVVAPLGGPSVFKQDGFFAGSQLRWSAALGYLVVGRQSDGTRLWRAAGLGRAAGAAVWQAVALQPGCQPALLQVSDDERHAAYTCGADLVLAELPSGRSVAQLAAKVNAMAFAPGDNGPLLVHDGQHLRALSRSNLSELARTALPLKLADAHITVAQHGPAAASLVLAGQDLQAAWSWPGLRPLGQRVAPAGGYKDDPRIAISPGGAWMAVFGEQQLQLVRLQPAWSAQAPISLPGPVLAVAFDLPRGLVAAVVAARRPEREPQHQLRLWTLEHGRQPSVRARIVLQRAAHALAFSPDGRRILADHLYDIDPATLVAAACALPVRNLSRSEWARELGDSAWRATCAGLGEPPAAALDWER